MGYTDEPENVRIEPGRGLVIEATREDHVYDDDPEQIERPIASARINTRDLFAAARGKFEITATLPDGDGVWPAFWLLSNNNVHSEGLNLNDYKDDNRLYLKVGGEIDIFEYYGKNPAEVVGTMHAYNSSRSGCVIVPDASGQPRVYAVELTDESLTWTIDDVPYHQVLASDDIDEWPFRAHNESENELYMVLNLAMGGDGGDPDLSVESWQMVVQKIRHYELVDSE